MERELFHDIFKEAMSSCDKDIPITNPCDNCILTTICSEICLKEAIYIFLGSDEGRGFSMVYDPWNHKNRGE